MPTHQSRPEQRRTAQTVTDARVSGEDDRSRRMKRYLVAMGVRTLSFPVAVWAFMQEYYVLAGAMTVLAAVIPSFAVMLANAVDRRQAPTTVAPVSPRQGLGPATAPSPTPAPAAQTGMEVITGTVVSRERTAYSDSDSDSDNDSDNDSDRDRASDSAEDGRTGSGAA